MIRVLLCEPNAELSSTLKQHLDKVPLWVVPAETAEIAHEHIDNQFYHICIWPVETRSDTEHILRLKSRRPETTIIATSQHCDPSLIVTCLHAGASNFWHKESTPETLVDVVTSTIRRVIPVEVTDQLEIQNQFQQMVGRHPKILEIFRLISRVKDADSSVFISGESGTGKELVAKAIHCLGNRKKKPWVAINCGAIPATLLESELFGHVKGAFTGAIQNRIGRFQLAGDGTLFLDEISDLSMDLQGKILRALQNKTFEPVGNPQSLELKARIVSATNQNLEDAVNERRFREDLFYRLNVIPVHIPALRSRKSDIPLLIKNFLDRFNEVNHRQIPGISEEAMRCLMQYHWPGNIRELENLVERVVVLKEHDDIIDLSDFPSGYFRNIRIDRFVSSVSLPEEGIDFNKAVNDFENELILQALRKTAGNKNQAAHLLALNRTTLVEKLKRKNLTIIS